MPGTVSGSVDHHTVTTSSFGSNQEFFTNLYRFFNGPLRSGGYVELVALQTGSSAGGTDYWDEGATRGTPFGENAFVVWRLRSGSVSGSTAPTGRRQVDVYYLFQWANNVNFGNSPGNPGLLLGAAGTKGTGIACAWRDDGLSPWNGTTLANGNDAKGATVWTAGTSSLRVFPRSNNTGGTHNTNKENLTQFTTQFQANTDYKYHFLHDRDSFALVSDTNADMSYAFLVYNGTYVPLTGFTSGSGGTLPMPMIQIVTNSLPFAAASTFGDTAGSSNTQGGIVGARMSGGVQVRGSRIDRLNNNLLASNLLQPNTQFPTNRYDEFQIPVMLFESPDFGLVGFLDMVTEVWNVNSHDVTPDHSRAVFGPNGTNVNVMLPWSGSAPGAGSTRTGRQF